MILLICLIDLFKTSALPGKTWAAALLCKASSLCITILSPPAIYFIKSETWCIVLQSLKTLQSTKVFALAKASARVIFINPRLKP